MKRGYYSLILLILLLCVWIPCTKVNAEEVKKSDLSTISTEVYINNRSIIEVTYANRIEGEELDVKSSDNTVLKVKMGKWNGDVKNIIVIPQKQGKVTLTITGPKKEKLQMVVHILSRKQCSVPDLYQNCRDAVVEVITTDSSLARNIGSGFFINDRMVVTNYHVIDCASNIQIRDYYGKLYEVDTIYDYNKGFDLAVLGIKGKAPSALICDYSIVETGLDVYALGSPLSYTGSISEGIVSKAYRERDGVIYHQNTASISQNSGGGPLLNSYGEVIGVNTSRIINGQNINFSLDIKYLEQLNYQNKAPIQTFYDENVGKIKIIELYITIP